MSKKRQKFIPLDDFLGHDEGSYDEEYYEEEQQPTYHQDRYYGTPDALTPLIIDDD